MEAAHLLLSLPLELHSNVSLLGLTSRAGEEGASPSVTLGLPPCCQLVLRRGKTGSGCYVPSSFMNFSLSNTECTEVLYIADLFLFNYFFSLGAKESFVNKKCAFFFYRVLPWKKERELERGRERERGWPFNWSLKRTIIILLLCFMGRPGFGNPSILGSTWVR